MRLILKIRAGSDAGSELFIDQGARVRVGRISPSEYAFPNDPGISRQHFAVECTANACRVQDLNSSNGTWVNRRRVSEAVLQEGDEIAAGDMVFVVHIERDQPPAELRDSARVAAPAYAQPQLTVDVSGESTGAPSDIKSAGPAKPAAPEPTLEEKLLGMLREDFQPLYAILDAARSPQIFKLLVEAKEEAQKLAQAQNPGAGDPAPI